VTVTDLRNEEQLSESIQSLKDVPVTFHLGEHVEEDFCDADFVVVNPAVPENSPWLAKAKLLESELNLFLKLCPSKRVVGVTGSNGKTTTTSLTGEMIRKAGESVYVGGNIGGSLLDSVDQMTPEDVIVLELSSFQLDQMRVLKRSPAVAGMLNLTPNHLDRHGTMENYVAAKRQIFSFQSEGDWKILNEDDEAVMAMSNVSSSSSLVFSLKSGTRSGARIEGESIRVTSEKGSWVIDTSGRRIPGLFNLQNMAAATALSLAMVGGGDRWRKGVEEVCQTFPGVPHRLEFVREKEGVRYYNDSIATSPESTMVALETLPGPIILLVGGYDKNLPMNVLADTIVKKAHVVVTYGRTGPRIADLIGDQGPTVIREEGFESALRCAHENASVGDTVLLSPACASYDLFRNFAERGDRFRSWVSGL
jgi:UDP-N-acetylmuramoylalanine--D-glutamate ligase